MTPPPGMGPLSSLGPPQDPHYKEVKEPVQYTGVTSAWLDWSVRFRRYVGSCTEADWALLKRLGRYLLGAPRLVQLFRWQAFPKTVDVFADS